MLFPLEVLTFWTEECSSGVSTCNGSGSKGFAICLVLCIDDVIIFSDTPDGAC